MSDAPTPIDGAISRAERKRLAAELEQLEPRGAYEIPVLSTPHAWTADNEIVLAAVPGDLPTMLVWDGAQGAWRGIYLPDGSRWRIVPDHAGSMAAES